MRQLFSVRHYVNSGVQQDSFPAPVLSGKAIFVPQMHIKVSSSSARRCIHFNFVMAGEKSIGKALLQVGFLSYLGLHNLHTQAVLLGKN